MTRPIDSAVLRFLRIPFKLQFNHAGADRSHSDSIVLELHSGAQRGYGEAVVRSYVTGSLGDGQEAGKEASRFVAEALGTLRRTSDDAKESLAALAAMDCPKRFLPLLCALETAFLDVCCAQSGQDVYDLLGKPPARETVVYGGILPIAPREFARRILAMYGELNLRSVRIKLNADPAYTEAVLALARAALGEGAALRVDVNNAWKERDAAEHLGICARHGVSLVEEPFPTPWAEHEGTLRAAAARGFRFVADESAVTAEDLKALARSGSCAMVNLRLSKNGGLSRTLLLARAASAAGMDYQIGCQVGETGILSALGRVASSLLPAVRFTDGSFDALLLSSNVTTEDFGFAREGKAAIVRAKGLGFQVDPRKLEAATASSIAC